MKKRRMMQPRQMQTPTGTAKSGHEKEKVTGEYYPQGIGSGWEGFTKLTAPRCAHDVTEIVEIGGVPIHVADGWGARKAPRDSVVLNCTGEPKWAEPVLPPEMQALRPHLEPTPVIEVTLPWPDGGIPPVEPTFWRALIEACAAQKAPLVIHCIGGHGRTGTALAAILIAYSVSADDAIEFVREKHCKKAIETASQEMYLDELDDILNGYDLDDEPEVPESEVPEPKGQKS